MNVKEYELTPLKKKLLRYTDEDTDDKELVYNVTNPIVELSPVVPLLNTGEYSTLHASQSGQRSFLRFMRLYSKSNVCRVTSFINVCLMKDNLLARQNKYISTFEHETLSKPLGTLTNIDLATVWFINLITSNSAAWTKKPCLIPKNCIFQKDNLA